MKITLYNKTKYTLKSHLINAIESGVDNYFPNFKNKSCNLILFTKRRITSLNKQLFRREEPTDVISVNNPDKLNPNIGDIYICPDVTQQNAEEYTVSIDEEITRVIIHGILHLLGFDHKKPFGRSKEKMFQLQEKILNNIKK